MVSRNNDIIQAVVTGIALEVYKVFSFFNTCCSCDVCCLYGLFSSQFYGYFSSSILFDSSLRCAQHSSLPPRLLPPAVEFVCAGLHNCDRNCTRRTTTQTIQHFGYNQTYQEIQALGFLNSRLVIFRKRHCRAFSASTSGPSPKLTPQKHAYFEPSNGLGNNLSSQAFVSRGIRRLN